MIATLLRAFVHLAFVHMKSVAINIFRSRQPSQLCIPGQFGSPDRLGLCFPDRLCLDELPFLQAQHNLTNSTGTIVEHWVVIVWSAVLLGRSKFWILVYVRTGEFDVFEHQFATIGSIRYTIEFHSTSPARGRDPWGTFETIHKGRCPDT